MNDKFQPGVVFGAVLVALSLASGTARADPFAFSTGTASDQIATASRPAGAAGAEVETADDFVLAQATQITSASFTGLLTGQAGLGGVQSVAIEIYRVFPFDSNNPPSGSVPTRTNSPSDVALLTRDSGASQLAFSASVLDASFLASNSVVNGIHPSPNTLTGGEGAVFGTEVQFDVTFLQALSLDAGHYFFIPQVGLSNGDFLWLSAFRPIVAPGTPFLPDLQSWIRDDALAPDWLRIGTDIVGNGQAFNAAFSLAGQTVAAVPEPATSALMFAGLALCAGVARRRVRGAALR